jgi:hypothetical protein
MEDCVEYAGCHQGILFHTAHWISLASLLRFTRGAQEICASAKICMTRCARPSPICYAIAVIGD